MGLFTRILEKIGIGRKDDDAFGTRPYEKAPGKPATRYAMRFEAGVWRFDGDSRIIAE